MRILSLKSSLIGALIVLFISLNVVLSTVPARAESLSSVSAVQTENNCSPDFYLESNDNSVGGYAAVTFLPGCLIDSISNDTSAVGPIATAIKYYCDKNQSQCAQAVIGLVTSSEFATDVAIVIGAEIGLLYLVDHWICGGNGVKIKLILLYTPGYGYWFTPLEYPTC